MPEQGNVTRYALALVVEAISRLNVALQGQILGGVGEAREIAALLQRAYNLTREEGDADESAVRGGSRSQQLLDVAPPALGPHNPAAGRVAHILEIVLREMTQIGDAWRMSWSGFDGRDLRAQLNEIKAWARQALVDPELPDFMGGTEFYNEHTGDGYD